MLNRQCSKIQLSQKQFWKNTCRHRLLGQTTKQPLRNFELQKPLKYKQLEGWGLTVVAYKKICVNYKIHAMWRSSCLQLFFKISVLKNFTILTEKHLWWSLFIIKLQAFRPATLLKRDSNPGLFLWPLRRL